MARTVMIMLLMVLHSGFLWGQKQGICGKVVWVSGNQMPGVNKKPEARPIQREIHIYEPVDASSLELANGLYKEIKGTLVKVISTEKDGTFRAALPPGEYSLFVKEPDGFFANQFDSRSRVNVISVNRRKFTNMLIRVNYKAFY
jgi:hypothetical protein